MKRLSASILVIAMLMQLMQAALIPSVYAEEDISPDSLIAVAEETTQDTGIAAEDLQDSEPADISAPEREILPEEEQVAATDVKVAENTDETVLSADEEDVQKEETQDQVSEVQSAAKAESAVTQDAEDVPADEEEQETIPETVVSDETVTDISEPAGSDMPEETETAEAGDGSEEETDETAEETAEADGEIAESAEEDQPLPFEKVISEGVSASDGRYYLVSVTYDETSGIPENGAMLKAIEITESDRLYRDYMDKTAEELGVDEAGLSRAVAFDISIVSTEDPTAELKPESAVKVAIEIPDEDPDIAILLLKHPQQQ